VNGWCIPGRESAGVWDETGDPEPGRVVGFPAYLFAWRLPCAARGRERTRSESGSISDRCGLVIEEEIGLRSFASLQLLRPYARSLKNASRRIAAAQL